MAMASPHLTAVPSEGAAPPPAGERLDGQRIPESGAQRIRRLQHEARMLAREQAQALADDLGALAARAIEIAEGGEAYPVGVRELASRIAADLPLKAQSLMSIMDRSGQA
jgi:hypothetical protein